MKIKIFIIIGLFSFQLMNSQTVRWSDNTTSVLEKGRKETGVFSPLKLGLKNSMEISTHPILFFVIPNIALKKQWKNEKIGIASVHKFTYPSILYKMLAREGTGGILPSTSVIPPIFKLNNSLLISKKLSNNTLTFNVGIDFALKAGESNFADIEYHMVYPRTYSLNNMFTPHVGFNFMGDFMENFRYDYNLNSYFFLKNNKGAILEHTIKLSWFKSDKFAVKAGTLITHGKYPGNKTDVGIFPVFDLMFGFGK